MSKVERGRPERSRTEVAGDSVSAVEPPDAPFVGREGARSLLLRVAQHAGGYGTRIVLVVGERGIGKTRLVAEVAKEAANQGINVAWGRVWEFGSPVELRPWNQVLRSILAKLPHLTRQHGAVLEQLAPRSVIPEEPVSPAPPLALCEGVLALLTDASLRTPLLVVLDDLHLADPTTLALLQFVSTDVGGGRFVIVGTYRDEEVTRHPYLTAALGRLDQRTRYVRLDPLGRADVQSYLRQMTGAEPSERLVNVVLDKTGGNAFFLERIAAYCAPECGHDTATVTVPPGVREEVIGYRLAGLSDECQRFLNAATVFGYQFDLHALELILGNKGRAAEAGKRAQVPALVAEALGSRIIAQVGGGAGQRYGFTYPVVRDVLYDHLPLPEKRQLHSAAAQGLVAMGPPTCVNELEDLANHFDCAGSSDGAEHAARYFAAAAQLHAADHRNLDAARLYERAISVLNRVPGAREIEVNLLHGQWLLRLAAVRRRAGDGDKGTKACERAVAIAQSLAGRATSEEVAGLLIEAAVERSAVRPWSSTGVVDDKAVMLLQDALRLLPDGDGVLRARAIAHAAEHFYHSAFNSGAWRETLSSAAVAMARRIGDLETLACVLKSRLYSAWFPENLQERLQLSTELVTLTRQLPDTDLRAESHLLRALNLLEAGDMVEMGRELLFCDELAVESGSRVFTWHTDVIRVTRAAFEGQIERAERLAYETLGKGQHAQPDDAGVFFGVHFYTVRRLQGSFEELLPRAKAFADQFPMIPVWRVNFADLYARLGYQAEAKAAFEFFAAADFEEPPRDWNWLLAMALLSEVCAFLGDQDRAAILYERLLPYAEQNVTAVPGLACIGPASYQLGLLATVLDRWDEAAAHFESAIARNLEMGGLPYVAQAQLAYTDLLGRCLNAMLNASDELVPLSTSQSRSLNRLGDQTALIQRSITLAANAAATYRQLQMNVYYERAQQLRDRIDKLGARLKLASEVNRFARDGNGWLITWKGQTVRLKDYVGLDYLVYLLRHPGIEIHVTQLLAEAGPGAAPEHTVHISRALAEGLRVTRSYGEATLLDPTARRAYRDRLREINEELGEARDNNDLGNMRRLEDERDNIATEIKNADRQLGSSGKLRKKVLRNLQYTVMVRLQEDLPGLAVHLRASLHTGTKCLYDPKESVRWNLPT